MRKTSAPLTLLSRSRRWWGRGITYNTVREQPDRGIMLRRHLQLAFDIL